MFSIIIPTYNQDYLLKETLESILKQTFKDWEALIINNYSNDQTTKVIESFNDKRIKTHNFNNNGIIAASRNYGISLSIFPYIAFLDSDDIWYPNKLEKSFFYLRNNYDIVCHDEIWMWSNGTKKHVRYGPEKKAKFKNLLFKGNVISTSTVSITKDILIELNGFNENPLMIGNEDYDLWMRIAMNSKYKFKFINETLGYYRIHKKNTSRNLFRQLKSEIFVIKQNFNVAKIKKNPLSVLKISLRIMKSILGSIIKNNDFIYKLTIQIRK